MFSNVKQKLQLDYTQCCSLELASRSEFPRMNSESKEERNPSSWEVMQENQGVGLLGEEDTPSDTMQSWADSS